MIPFQQLKQRKIFQWAAAYLAGAWLLLQLLSLLAQPFAWPDQVMRVAPVLLGIGFFAVLVLAWYHGEQGRQRASGIELMMLAGILLIAGISVMLISKRSAATSDRPANTAGSASSKSGAPEERSIAVLPFVNMSSDKEQEYFSDGLTEELLNVLAHMQGLRVAARTSAFMFKGARVSMDSVGRALNVAHVLEGSVRKSGDRVRITAQLIDARNGFHVWSETYDRELKDVFAVQDEISKAIASELEVKLEPRAAIAAPATSSDAHDLFLKGLQKLALRTGTSLPEAEALFKRAIAADPAYADAQAGLAMTAALLPQYHDVDAHVSFEKGRAAAARALALDPRNATAHAALAQIAQYAGDLAAAEREARTAIALNPNFSTAYQWLAEALVHELRFADALAAADQAFRLDPLNAITAHIRAGILADLGRYDDADREFSRAIALNPALSRARYGNAVMLLGTRRYERGRMELKELFRDGRQDTAAADIIVDGLSIPARRPLLVKLLSSQRGFDSMGASGLVLISIAAGQPDSAIAYANRYATGPISAVDLRWWLYQPWASSILRDPRLAPVPKH